MIIMLQYFKNKIYFSETLKNKYSTIIELFVLYYGEEYRRLIEEQISNTTIVCYYPNELLWNDLQRLKVNKAKELSLKFFEEIEEIGLSLGNKTKQEFEWYYLAGAPNTVLALCQRYLSLEKPNKELKNKVWWCFKKFDNSVTINNLDQKISNGEFDFLNVLIQKHNKARQELNDYESQYAWVIDFSKEETKLQEECFFKIWKEFVIEHCSKIIPEDELKIIQQSEKVDKKDIPTTCFYVGYLFDSFDLNAEVLTKNLLLFPKITKDVITVLNKMGFNYGDDINSYLNKKEIQKLISSFKLIYELKDEYRKLAEKEFVINSTMANMIMDQMDEKTTIFTKPMDEAIYLLIRKGMLGSLSFDVSSDTYEINPILTLDLGDITNSIDKKLIHELNHRLEMQLLKKEGDSYEYKCGWQKGHKSPNEDKIDPEYRWFNEVINDIISSDINKLMIDNNISVFGRREGTEKFSESSYKKGIELLMEFFKDNWNAVISSRLTGNMNYLYDEIGKENFEALNNLINTFFHEFEGINYINLIADLETKKESNLTRKYNEILMQKNIIMQNIENYKIIKTTKS